MKFSTVVLCAVGSAFLSTAAAGFCRCCKEKVNPDSPGDSGPGNQAQEDSNDKPHPLGEKGDVLDSASRLGGGSNFSVKKEDATGLSGEKNADAKTSEGGADSSKQLNGDIPSNLNTDPSAHNDNLHPITKDSSTVTSTSSEGENASKAVSTAPTSGGDSSASGSTTASSPPITSISPAEIDSSSSETDKSEQGSGPEDTPGPASHSLDTQDDPTKVNPSESSLDDKLAKPNVLLESTTQTNPGEGEGEERSTGTQAGPKTGTQPTPQPESKPRLYQRVAEKVASYLPSFGWISTSNDNQKDQSDNLAIF